MEEWIDNEVRKVFNKLRRDTITYCSLANILNRREVPCYFSPDTYWTALHMKNWLNGDNSYFDQAQYRKNVFSLVYYKVYIQGMSQESILQYLNSHSIINPNNGLPWTEYHLKLFLAEVKPHSNNTTANKEKKMWEKQRKCLLGLGKNISTPRFLLPNPLSYTHEESEPSI